MIPEIDGVAMDFPSVSVFANLFLGNYEYVQHAVKIKFSTIEISRYFSNVNAARSINILIQFKGLPPLLHKNKKILERKRRFSNKVEGEFASLR